MSAPFNPWHQALVDEGVLGTPLEKIAMLTKGFESGGDNSAVSNRGARGLMQVMPGTFNDVADPGWDINNEYHNARAGIRYLKQGWKASGGDPKLTGAYYYGGPGGMAKARQGIAVSDPMNPNYPNTIEYGQRLADAYGANGMSTNFPNYMANLQRTMPGIYQQLAGIVQDPQIDPALVQGIAEKRQKNIQMLPLAVGAMLSGDRGIRDFGKEMYTRGEDARNMVAIGDEGYVDPETGKFLNSPVGTEKRALALSLAALDSQDKLAKVGADQEIAMATLENNEWYRKNQVALEKMGVDLRMFKNQMEIMQWLTDPENEFRLRQAGIDPYGFMQSAFGKNAAPSAPDMAAPTGIDPAQQGAPMPAQGAPMPAVAPSGAAPMPAQGAPGASIMAPNATGGLDMATGRMPVPQPGAAVMADGQTPPPSVPATAPDNRPVFKSIPGLKPYGIDPADGLAVGERDGIYFKMNPQRGGYQQIDGPPFKNNDRLKAEADAMSAQRGLNDANAWVEQNAKDPNSPYVNYEHFLKTSPAEAESARKLLDQRRSDIETARQTNVLLEEFKMLNARDQTGGLLETPFPDSTMIQMFSPDSKRMQSISAEIKANSVPKGQGAVSDAERRLFGASVPGLQYEREVNDAIIGMYQLRMRFREDAAKLEQEFFNTYKHTNGMQQVVAEQLEQKYQNDPEYQRLSSMIPNSPVGGSSGAQTAGQPKAKPKFTVLPD
jgi:hypothetical protein